MKLPIELIDLIASYTEDIEQIPEEFEHIKAEHRPLRALLAELGAQRCVREIELLRKHDWLINNLYIHPHHGVLYFPQPGFSFWDCLLTPPK